MNVRDGLLAIHTHILDHRKVLSVLVATSFNSYVKIYFTYICLFLIAAECIHTDLSNELEMMTIDKAHLRLCILYKFQQWRNVSLVCVCA